MGTLHSPADYPIAEFLTECAVKMQGQVDGDESLRGMPLESVSLALTFPFLSASCCHALSRCPLPDPFTLPFLSWS